MVMLIQDFLDALSTQGDDSNVMDFCRKYVLHGTPHVFNGRENEYYDFRKKIAERFKISFHEVYITGSAKLGFSPYKGTDFSYDSDIDIAIVSNSLFESVMELVREYQMNLRASRRAVTAQELKVYHQFLEYTAIGWIRPDKLPLAFRVNEYKGDWFQFFESLSYGRSEVGNYKVSAGVFRSYRDLELYTYSTIQQLKSSIEIKRQTC